MGSKSATLRHPAEGRLISPPIGVKIRLAIGSRFCYDAAMNTQDMCSEDTWPYVLRLLPADLEESARETGALVRRKKIPAAAALMRVIMAYAVSDLSMKDVGAWASALGLAALTGPAVFYRLRLSEAWLQRVLGQVLQNELIAAPSGHPIRIVDATVINGPGATGIDWRVHAVVDPESGRIQSVEVTDRRGGESFRRHELQPEEIILGDRMYCTAPGIHSVVKQNAHVLARVNPQSIRVCNLKKEKINLLRYGVALPRMGSMGLDVLIPVPPEKTTKSHKTWDLAKAVAWIPGRIVVVRTIKGNVIWVLTTLTPGQISDEKILELYRVRWQVELLFKRLKSLLHFDALPSGGGPTAKTWILARLLAAAMAQKMVRPAGPFPRGRSRPGETPLHAQFMVKVSHDALGSKGGGTLRRSLASHQ